MKKLMIAAAVVALAAVSQAASINWKVTTPGEGATYKDYKVYICEALADGGFKNEAEISSYLLGDVVNTGTIKNNRGDGSSSGSLTGLDDGKAGQMQNFYAVIVAADGSGYWTTTGSAEIYTSSTEHTDYNANINNVLAGAKTDWSTGPVPPGPEPVPEPTSAMLLLLGVAGLALRRKQA